MRAGLTHLRQKIYFVPTGLSSIGLLIILPISSPAGTVPEGQHIGRKQNKSQNKVP